VEYSKNSVTLDKLLTLDNKNPPFYFVLFSLIEEKSPVLKKKLVPFLLTYPIFS